MVYIITWIVFQVLWTIVVGVGVYVVNEDHRKLNKVTESLWVKSKYNYTTQKNVDDAKKQLAFSRRWFRWAVVGWFTAFLWPLQIAANILIGLYFLLRPVRKAVALSFTREKKDLTVES